MSEPEIWVDTDEDNLVVLVEGEEYTFRTHEEEDGYDWESEPAPSGAVPGQIVYGDGKIKFVSASGGDNTLYSLPATTVSSTTGRDVAEIMAVERTLEAGVDYDESVDGSVPDEIQIGTIDFVSGDDEIVGAQFADFTDTGGVNNFANVELQPSPESGPTDHDDTVNPFSDHFSDFTNFSDSFKDSKFSDFKDFKDFFGDSFKDFSDSFKDFSDSFKDFSDSFKDSKFSDFKDFKDFFGDSFKDFSDSFKDFSDSFKDFSDSFKDFSDSFKDSKFSDFSDFKDFFNDFSDSFKNFGDSFNDTQSPFGDSFKDSFSDSFKVQSVGINEGQGDEDITLGDAVGSGEGVESDPEEVELDRPSFSDSFDDIALPGDLAGEEDSDFSDSIFGEESGADAI